MGAARLHLGGYVRLTMIKLRPCCCDFHVENPWQLEGYLHTTSYHMPLLVEGLTSIVCPNCGLGHRTAHLIVVEMLTGGSR